MRTVPGSPAERAGIRGVNEADGTIGDVIVAIDGKAVRKLSDLTDQLQSVTLPGKAEITLQRGGSQRTTSVDVVDMGRS
jgi:S1-C subfamily serine protease